MEVRSQGAKPMKIARRGSHPVELAAAALVVIVLGVGSVAIWRSYTGNSPEQERIAAARQLQAKATQTSEQLVEKTTGLEVTQQESIDQLQVVQDQLQAVRRMLAGQQADTKRLSDQVSTLTESIDSLRQSFASVQTNEASVRPVSRNKSIRTRPHATTGAQTKPARAPGVTLRTHG